MIAKIILVLVFVAIVTLAKAETKIQTTAELPPSFLGEWWANTEGTNGMMNRPSIPRPFGTFEPKKIVLSSGEALIITSVSQFDLPSVVPSNRVSIVSFHNHEMKWVIIPRQKTHRIVTMTGNYERVTFTGNLFITQEIAGQTNKVHFLVTPRKKGEPDASPNRSPAAGSR